MMDDSVQYWVGVTLANDTQRFFDREPGYTAQTTDISLADVLTYFQLQPDIMKQFGMFGFYRFNGWPQERAYDRTHCTKAILLNLDKLKDIDYEKGAHTWEDLKLSWDMQGVKWEEGQGKNNVDCDTSAPISCKLYRFQVSSPQLHHGGCAHMVARPDAPEPVVPEPVVPEPHLLPVPDMIARVARMELAVGIQMIQPAGILMARIEELERQCRIEGAGGMQGRVAALEEAVG
jgi:hypothetical protein